MVLYQLTIIIMFNIKTDNSSIVVTNHYRNGSVGKLDDCMYDHCMVQINPGIATRGNKSDHTLNLPYLLKKTSSTALGRLYPLVSDNEDQENKQASIFATF